MKRKPKIIRGPNRLKHPGAGSHDGTQKQKNKRDRKRVKQELENDKRTQPDRNS